MSDKKIITATNMSEVKQKFGETVARPDHQVEMTQQTIKGASEENRRLRGVGEMLKPPLTEYVGSIAVHIYRVQRLDGAFDTECRTQSCLDPVVTPNEVKGALYAQSVAVAEKYGYKLTAAQQKTIKEA